MADFLLSHLKIMCAYERLFSHQFITKYQKVNFKNHQPHNFQLYFMHCLAFLSVRNQQQKGTSYAHRQQPISVSATVLDGYLIPKREKKRNFAIHIHISHTYTYILWAVKRHFRPFDNRLESVENDEHFVLFYESVYLLLLSLFAFWFSSHLCAWWFDFDSDFFFSFSLNVNWSSQSKRFKYCFKNTSSSYFLFI